jgi:hypothetical protein
MPRFGLVFLMASYFAKIDTINKTILPQDLLKLFLSERAINSFS